MTRVTVEFQVKANNAQELLEASNVRARDFFGHEDFLITDIDAEYNPSLPLAFRDRNSPAEPLHRARVRAVSFPLEEGDGDD